jgi:hypothetical protein
MACFGYVIVNSLHKGDNDDNNNYNINNTQPQALYSLILLYTSIPHPLQSQSTLYNQLSTHLPLFPLYSFLIIAS